MKLSSLLQKLSYGPLSELPISGEGAGTIPAEHLPKLMLRANHALLALYSRFRLVKKVLVISTISGRYDYPLRAEFAQSSSSTEIEKFIKDSPASPFLGNVLMITDIFDSLQCPVPFNDAGQDKSWFSSEYDVLTMSYPLTGTDYFVCYVANPDELPLVPQDAELVDVRLPPQLELAFLHKVAGLTYGAMSMEGALTKANLNENIYERECQYHEAMDTFHTSHSITNLKSLLGDWPR